jgi:hypothetical protein
LFSSVLATSAFMAGVRTLGASRASIVSSAEPALTAVFAFAAFGQRFGLVQLLGAALVLASVPILELRRTATQRHHERTPPGRASVQSHARPRVGLRDVLERDDRHVLGPLSPRAPRSPRAKIRHPHEGLRARSRLARTHLSPASHEAR